MCVCVWGGGGSTGLCSLLNIPSSKSFSAWFLPWSSALTAEPADDWRPTEPDSRYCPSATLATHSAMQLTRWLGASIHPSIHPPVGHCRVPMSRSSALLSDETFRCSWIFDSGGKTVTLHWFWVWRRVLAQSKSSEKFWLCYRHQLRFQIRADCPKLECIFRVFFFLVSVNSFEVEEEEVQNRAAINNAKSSYHLCHSWLVLSYPLFLCAPIVQE